MPPVRAMSGIATSTPPLENISRKPQRVYSFSPVAIGMPVEARTTANPSRSIGESGSSYQVMSYSAMRRPKRMAVGRSNAVLMSTISPTSGPIASRSARTRRTSSSGSTPTWVLTRRNPASAKRAASRAMSAGSCCQCRSEAYASIESRQSPPISLQTGCPSALPMTSQQAMSMPLMPATTAPFGSYIAAPSKARCQISSTLNGSSPSTSGRSLPSTTPSARAGSHQASPSPSIPSSVVIRTSETTRRLRACLALRCGCADSFASWISSTSTIFTAPPRPRLRRGDSAHGAHADSVDALSCASVAAAPRSGHPEWRGAMRRADVTLSLVLRLVDLSKSYGARPILDDVSLTIPTGEKIALVGANGAGKTTLLRIVTGDEEADAGAVQLANGWTIGYVPQDAGVQDELTVHDEMLAAHADLLALQHEAAEIERSLHGDLPEEELGRLVDRHAEVLARFEARGGYRVEAEIHKILSGLGFRQEDLTRRTDEFSGGWRTRIALAKLLVRAPDMLLLDEPTNHLDLEATEWLEQYLKASGASAIVVSHDRYFLDRMISRTVELERGQLVEYAGNYSYFLGEKERRFAAAQAAYERQQRELKRQQGFIDRFRAKATKATQVKSREKALAKVERVEAPRVESRGMALRFPPAKPSHREVVTLQNVVKRYGPRTVFDGLALTLDRGERLALVGPNGAGKSTLLRMLAEVEMPDRGTLLLGAGVTAGYYAQDQTDVLNVGRSVLEEA